MRKKLLIILLPLACLLSLSLFAAPDEERTPASGGAPLTLFASQVSDLFVPQSGDFKNRLILGSISSGIDIIDTETWELFEDQPNDFDNTVGGMALLGNGTSLIVTLANGDLGRIELDEIKEENADVDEANADDSADPRVIFLTDETSGGALTSIVADPDSNDEVVYFINPDGNLLFSFDLSTEILTTIELDSQPNDLVFADSSAGEKIYICTQDGNLLVLEAGGTEVTTIEVPATDAGLTDDPDLTSITVSPDGNFIYILDPTNSAIWVLDAESDAFLDQQTGNSTDPIRIESDENSNLQDIVIPDVSAFVSVQGFVSGDDGLTILDADDPEDATADRKIIDQDTGTPDVLDPLTLTGIPGPVAASTATDRYVYSSNGNGEISVISDNPFITIAAGTSITLDGTTTTFSLTFQSDEAGTYRVVINSDIEESSGTTLISDTTLGESEVNTDVTTVTINSDDFDRDIFEEGTNRVFIFLEDAEGNKGRDAVDISVDRPPPAVTITDSNFGNEKAFVTFNKLTDEDINVYRAVAKEAASQTSPTCPGSLDFTVSPKIESTKSHGDCEDSCTIIDRGLTNGTVYCLAVRAEDTGGQNGDFAFVTTPITPEKTVGPAGLLGETGCALNQSSANSRWPIIFILFNLVFFSLFRLRKRCYSLFLIFCFSFLFSTSFSFAQEPGVSQPESAKAENQREPTWGYVGDTEENPLVLEEEAVTVKTEQAEFKPIFKWFTFELKGAFFIPTNDVVEDFFGKCCNLVAEAEFGVLYKSQFNATVAIGFMRETAQAVGAISGLPSGDSVTLLLIPFRNNFIYRFDYLREQVVVPYVGTGIDYVFFRETVNGSSTSGVKFGVHGMVGVSFLLDKIENIGAGLANVGIDDVYFTIEGRYSKINSFKSTGLDLSGLSFYFGLMMAF